MGILIWLSHGLNLMLLGSPYEMTCSRAWRLRNQNVFWKFLQISIDYFSPFRFWRTPKMTHCEWCFESEKERGIYV